MEEREQELLKAQSPENFIKDFSQIIRRLQNSVKRDLTNERNKVVSANKYLREAAVNSRITYLKAMFIYKREEFGMYNMGEKFQICPASFDEENFGFVLGGEIGFESTQLGAADWFLAVLTNNVLYFIPVNTLADIQIRN